MWISLNLLFCWCSPIAEDVAIDFRRSTSLPLSRHLLCATDSQVLFVSMKPSVCSGQVRLAHCECSGAGRGDRFASYWCKTTGSNICSSQNVSVVIFYFWECRECSFTTSHERAVTSRPDNAHNWLVNQKSQKEEAVFLLRTLYLNRILLVAQC